MKKLTIAILLLLLAFPAISGAAGSSVVQGSVVNVGETDRDSNPSRTITFLCTGDDGTGAVSNEVITVATMKKSKVGIFTRLKHIPRAVELPRMQQMFLCSMQTVLIYWDHTIEARSR